MRQALDIADQTCAFARMLKDRRSRRAAALASSSEGIKITPSR